jgi:hypothetical protein
MKKYSLIFIILLLISCNFSKENNTEVIDWNLKSIPHFIVE